MNKKATLKQIADQLGVNTVMVGRALRHCGGVDTDKAEQIRRLADQLGGWSDNDKAAPFCGMVMPKTPLYFWDPVMQNIRRILSPFGITVRGALYLDILNEKDFFSALDNILEKSPSVLVVVCPPTEPARERVRQLAKAMPVFLLGEYVKGENLFYFGCNQTEDAVALAAAYRVAYPHHRRMLVADIFENSERTRSFLSACPDISVVQHIEIPTQYLRAASFLARQIADVAPDSFDCVYVGSAAMPQICHAMIKLHIDPNIPCIGFENPPGNQPYWESGRITLVSEQDIGTQCELCAAAVAEFYRSRCFPTQKNFYVPSKIITAPH